MKTQMETHTNQEESNGKEINGKIVELNKSIKDK